MKAWAERHKSAVATQAKAAAKSLGPSRGQPKRKVGEATAAAGSLEELTVATARLSLHTARQTRILAGACMRTVLLPLWPLATQMEASGIVQQADGQALEPEVVWVRLVVLLLELDGLEASIRTHL